MRSLVSLLLMGLLLVPTTSKANHDFHKCQFFVTAAPPVLKIKFCQWDLDRHFDNDKIAQVILAVRQGAPLKEPLSVTVVVVEDMLHPNMFGLFEPASKVIYLNGAIPDNNNFKFYYTFGHELVHAVLDQQHMSWDKQHCFMAGPVLDPLRALITSWNAEAQFENRLQLVLACPRGGE